MIDLKNKKCWFNFPVKKAETNLKSLSPWRQKQRELSLCAKIWKHGILVWDSAEKGIYVKREHGII